MSMTDKTSSVTIVGVEPGEPMEIFMARHRELLDRADIAFTPKKLLGLLSGIPNLPVESIGADISQLSRKVFGLLEQGRQIVILSNGDPLFFGIGASLAKVLPPQYLKIIPAPGALQLAAARSRLPWHDVIAVSFHGRKSFNELACAVRTRYPVCALTDPYTGADVLADFLRDRGCSNFDACVFTDLGQASEKVWRMPLEKCAEIEFPPGATVLLLPGHEKSSDKAPRGHAVTKAGVSGVILEALDLSPWHVLWDIGAGAGHVSLAAARFVREVYAVEMQPCRALDIQYNRKLCQAANVAVKLGYAPDCLADLPMPDRIFIGGALSSGNGEILGVCLEALPVNGKLVISSILQETFQFCADWLSSKGLAFTARSVGVAQYVPLGKGHYFKPHNPIQIMEIVKA